MGNTSGIVSIHGKDYKTVAQRVKEALGDHEVYKDGSAEQIEVATEVIQHSPSVVIKAVVKTKRGSFSGISSVNLSSNKLIEKENPYEVAETSAVGRALGFAGYGLIDDIASADEVQRATRPTKPIENKTLEQQEMDESISQTEYVPNSIEDRRKIAILKWIKALSNEGKIEEKDYDSMNLAQLQQIMSDYKKQIGK